MGTTAVRTAAVVAMLACAGSAQVTEVTDGSEGRPSALAVNSAGRLVVARAYGGNGDPKVLELEPDGTWAVLLDASGDGSTPFDTCYSLAAGDDGSVYAASTGSDAVFRIAEDGTVSAAWALPEPLYVAVDAAGALCASTIGDEVFRRDTDGTVTRLIGPEGDGASPLENVVAIEALDGAAFVAGYASNNVFRVDPDGSVVELIDETYPHPLTFGSMLLGPRGMDLGPDGTVYVAGELTNNLVAILPDGSIEEHMDVSGDRLGHPLLLPQDVACDNSGRVFVSSWGANSVLRDGPFAQRVIDEHGASLWSGGSNAASLLGPATLSASDSGDLYVLGVGTDNVFRVAGCDCELVPDSGNLGGPTVTNPASFQIDSAALGRDFSFTVDLAITGHDMARVVALDTAAAPMTLGAGQVLLIQDGGSGPLIDTGFHPGPLAKISFPVPPLPELVWFRFYAQAIHAFGVTPFALSNARFSNVGGMCPY